jgi:hypothetical protein
MPTIQPRIDPNKNQGYLSLSIFPDLTTMPHQVAPFPKCLPSLDIDKNTGYPSFDNLPSVEDIPFQVAPYPRMIPQLVSDKNTGYPSFSGLLSIENIPTQVAPFPKMITTAGDINYDQGYPTLRRDEPNFGAFSNIPTLEKITIPQTVKYIADYVFYNTALLEVKIARDCVFFEHTFPSDCVISYYE